MQLLKILKWPILGGFGFLIFVTAIFAGIRVFTSSPSKADCNVYKALTTEIHASDWGYVEVFRPYVLPLNDPNFEDRISWVSTVIHRTSQKKLIPATDDYEGYEVFLTKDIKVTLSNKNWTSSIDEKKTLGKCYSRKERPDISTLSLNALALRETAKGGPKDALPNIWQLSEVIKSENGRYAIVFANSSCGGLCGWSGFYLFKNTNENWVVVGSRTESIS